jgi:uncharacterized integral membrane protein
MPLRLVAVFLIVAVFLVFVMFNLDNRCNINFGFKEFKEVPVFMTIFISFILGLLCALPFFLRSKKLNKEKPVNEKRPLIKTSRFFKGKEAKSGGGSHENV